MLIKKLGKRLRNVISNPENASLNAVVKTIKSSGKFDKQWYLKHYPDIAGHPLWRKHPEKHYVIHGATEGRDPSATFNSRWYLEEHDDVSEIGMNPLLHYILHGEREGRLSQGRNKSSGQAFSRANPLTGLKSAHKTVDLIRRNILNNGFEESGLAELKTLFKEGTKLRSLLAAQELALYFLNQGTAEAIREALVYLDYCEASDVYELKSDDAYLIMRVEALLNLNQADEAKALLENHAANDNTNPDIALAWANVSGSLSDKLTHVNQIYTAAGLAPIGIELKHGEEPYVGLHTKNAPEAQIPVARQPLITVIVPAYNAQGTIGVALSSLLEQSWQNIEVLVADDCSTDDTRAVVAEFAEQDSRIKLVKVPRNGGPYVARNYALREAKGEFVTCNDADDWSHSQKLEVQARHLIEHEEVMGNTSLQARSNPDMTFYRRGNFGHYIFNNMSSFMFRREPVLACLGSWDSVRFGADSEFIRRIKKCFGAENVVNLDTPPFSFQRQSSDSLTGSSAFGYHGFFMGARKDYFETYLEYHKQPDSEVFYPFPQKKRFFAIPEPMRPDRETKDSNGYRRFDVIIASDFRLDGGSTLSSIEEIKAHQNAGLRTGLVQLYRYDYNPRKKINPRVRELLDGNSVEMIVFGEKAKCDHLIVRYPPVLQHQQTYIPEIITQKTSVIINQPPMSDYGENAVLRYELPKANQHVERWFDKPPIWYTIGPAVRNALETHHSAQLAEIALSQQDWPNVIDVADWARDGHRPARQNIVIGRHSRDSLHKWPGDKDTLLKIYPESDNVTVAVLGGASAVQSVVGYIPGNWQVHEFGELTPQAFLSKLDVFVYYTHADWVESFGRVVLEAMAVGVPVILPGLYRPLFGDAAIYAEVSEVEKQINRLVGDTELYQNHVEKGLRLVREKFSYNAHISRL